MNVLRRAAAGVCRVGTSAPVAQNLRPRFAGGWNKLAAPRKFPHFSHFSAHNIPPLASLAALSGRDLLTFDANAAPALRKESSDLSLGPDVRFGVNAVLWGAGQSSLPTVSMCPTLETPLPAPPPSTRPSASPSMGSSLFAGPAASSISPLIAPSSRGAAENMSIALALAFAFGGSAVAACEPRDSDDDDSDDDSDDSDSEDEHEDARAAFEGASIKDSTRTVRALLFCFC